MGTLPNPVHQILLPCFTGTFSLSLQLISADFILGSCLICRDDFQAGLFFLKHAEALEKDLPARELHELLLLSLQWLSGMITLTNP